MTQILTPFRDKIKNKNRENRDAIRFGMQQRMCWTCQQEKPIKGGEFPNRVSMGATRDERFRCADCTQRLLDKRAAALEKLIEGL